MIISGKLANLEKSKDFLHKPLPSSGGLGNPPKSCFSYLPRKLARGNPQFGNGSAYPGPQKDYESGVGAHLFTAIRQFWRPAIVLVRANSFVKVHETGVGDATYVFGPWYPSYRSVTDRSSRYLHQCICGNLGYNVSILRNENDSLTGEPPDWAVSMSYFAEPVIGIPEDFKEVGDVKVTEAYLKQSCSVSVYDVNLAGSVASISDINFDHLGDEAFECFPRTRFADIGFCEVDFVNQLDSRDDPNLKFKFPLYRDTYREDGGVPDCGFDSPSSVKTLRTEVRLACFVWDTEKKEYPITDEMRDEIENLIDDNLTP